VGIHVRLSDDGDLDRITRGLAELPEVRAARWSRDD